MRDASEVVTEKLYEKDAYLRSFEGRVLQIDGRDVVLDRTAFFPEEGGQSPDTGTLGGCRVGDVRIRDGLIHHMLEEDPSFREGETVCGELDWERRLSNMQQHSGEHLLSGAVHRRYGYENVGFHLSDSEVTLDFNGELDEGQLRELEEEVNRAIRSDVPSRVFMTQPEDRRDLVYRSKLDLPGEVRIVEFPGLDVCACCAPHVARTGEIGLLKITGAIRYKGGVRVSIVCGGRAMALFAREHDLLTKTARYLTTSPDNLYEQTVRDKEEIRRLKERAAALTERLLAAELAALPPEEDHVILFTEEAEMPALREAANRAVRERGGYAALFAGSDRDGYSFILRSDEADTGPLCAALRKSLGARGGGRPEMAQGSVKAAAAAIRQVLEGSLIRTENESD